MEQLTNNGSKYELSLKASLDTVETAIVNVFLKS